MTFEGVSASKVGESLLLRLRRRLGQKIVAAFESPEVPEIYMVEGSDRIWLD